MKERLRLFRLEVPPSNVNSSTSRSLAPREQRKSNLLSHLGLYFIVWRAMIIISWDKIHHHRICGFRCKKLDMTRFSERAVMPHFTSQILWTFRKRRDSDLTGDHAGHRTRCSGVAVRGGDSDASLGLSSSFNFSGFFTGLQLQLEAQHGPQKRVKTLLGIASPLKILRPYFPRYHVHALGFGASGSCS